MRVFKAEYELNLVLSCYRVDIKRIRTSPPYLNLACGAAPQNQFLAAFLGGMSLTGGGSVPVPAVPA